MAPSDELRRWYGHQPDWFAEFERRYEAELTEPERAGAVSGGSVRPGTLLMATRDLEHSAAAVLAVRLRSD